MSLPFDPADVCGALSAGLCAAPNASRRWGFNASYRHTRRRRDRGDRKYQKAPSSRQALWYQAAIDAADDIGFAVVAITLTIVAIFLPVSFIGGGIGQYFRQFGITVAAAVLACQ